MDSDLTLACSGRALTEPVNRLPAPESDGGPFQVFRRPDYTDAELLRRRMNRLRSDMTGTAAISGWVMETEESEL
jgi:hypothetical protein